MEILKTKHLKKIYEGKVPFTALKDINFTIREGVNIPKWRSHLIRQNRATYSNLENHLIQITEPGNPI